jgi:hypothetical protein
VDALKDDPTASRIRALIHSSKHFRAR